MMTHPTATIMKEHIDLRARYDEGSRYVVEQWGWRYCLGLEDTPYTLGEINLAGWNSDEEMVKGKKAFRSIGQQPWLSAKDRAWLKLVKELQDLTCAQLKKRLRAINKPVSGRKAELIKRIRDHEQLTEALFEED